MTASQPIKLDQMSHRQQWAALALRQVLAEEQTKAVALPFDANVSQLAPVKDTRLPAEANAPEPTFRIGIIGAGVAGIFTAMLFDHLKEKYGLKVEYEILEANPEQRLGGRLYTYRFKEEDPNNISKPSNHQYYDVGAMRFPDIDIMHRTFKLFERLGMEKNHTPDKTPPTIGSLVPYKFVGKNQPSSYNGKQYVLRDPKDQNHPTAQDYGITGLPINIMTKPPGEVIDKAIVQWTKLYKTLADGDERTGTEDGAKQFWELLTQQCDHYTVRQYLTQVSGFNYDTIEFLETLNFGNRWYDQAFSEMVLESLDFGGPLEDWWCVEGGSNEIAQRMRKEIKQQSSISFDKRVTAMSFVYPDRAGHTNNKIRVTVARETITREPYDAVFNSAPLGAMQQMGLEGLNLNWGTKSAIRSLGYGASCKIGIQFKTLWWKRKGIENVWEKDGAKQHLDFDCEIREGGLAKTDMPIRCCVYPSYNLYDPDDQPGVLLASYTWSQEAERIGALIHAKDNALLKEVVIHDLARLHALQIPSDPVQTEKNFLDLQSFLYDQWIDSYAYNWYADPTTVGAFAYFGPNQFQKMYPHVTASDGKYIIIGEAASAHHAWVVGALESAVRGVYQFLYYHSKISKAAKDAADDYSHDRIDDGLFGPLPAEYDTTTENPENVITPEEIGKKGDLARMQVLFEAARQRQGGDYLRPEGLGKEELAPILDAVGQMKSTVVGIAA